MSHDLTFRAERVRMGAVGLALSMALVLVACDQAGSQDQATGSSPSTTAGASASNTRSASGGPAASGSPSAAASVGQSPSEDPAANASGDPSLTPGQILALFSADEDGGGPSNIVRVINQTDGKVRSDGRVQDKRLHGPNANPVNQAFAYSSCVR